MANAMIFIDGNLLYSSSSRLSEAFGKPDYKVDFNKLPRVLAEEVSKQLGLTEVTVVRTYLFGSIASNYDARDEEAVQRRRDFFEMLSEEYHYEVEIYPVNYMGKRLRKVDREQSDLFEPKEKCVDISLATTMLYYAAIPYAYDIAIAVLGDRDFKPVLQHLRRLGKRVAIASIHGSCADDFQHPESRVKDFDIIWLD
ncbi:MAG: NYN domain-containing protein, partial [bacterium]|nr:NYN domain-containing protein [bacterium]